MQILFLSVTVTLSLFVSSFAKKSAQNSLLGGSFPGDFSQLSTSSAVKLAVNPDANTDTTNWILNTFYLGSGCSGSVIMTYYISTGFCYPTSNPNVHYTYSCNSGKLIPTSL
jgi:hypothetical protein